MVGNLIDKVLTHILYLYYINKCSRKIHVVSHDFVFSIKIPMAWRAKMLSQLNPTSGFGQFYIILSGLSTSFCLVYL